MSNGKQVFFSVLKDTNLLITKIFQRRIDTELTENDNHEICDLISKISPYIRFIGIISKTGELLSHFKRDGIEPLLDQKKSLYQFAQIAIKNELEEQFDEQLGETEFVWEEKEKYRQLHFQF